MKTVSKNGLLLPGTTAAHYLADEFASRPGPKNGEQARGLRTQVEAIWQAGILRAFDSGSQHDWDDVAGIEMMLERTEAFLIENTTAVDMPKAVGFSREYRDLFMSKVKLTLGR